MPATKTKRKKNVPAKTEIPISSNRLAAAVTNAFGPMTDYCEKNSLVPQDLIDFHRKYSNKVALLGLDQKKVNKDNVAEGSFRERLLAHKNGDKSALAKKKTGDKD